MDTIERLLRMKYLLPDEEEFEPAASEVRHLTGTDIMKEIAELTDEYYYLDNELLNKIRDKLDELNVKHYFEERNGSKLLLYKVVNKHNL